jgi:hypothetical protein
MNYRIDEIKFKEFISKLEDLIYYAINKKDAELDGKIQDMILALGDAHTSINKYAFIKEWGSYWTDRAFNSFEEALNGI